MKKEKILIVDDVPENIDILVSLLKDKYDIIASKDGKRAIELTMEIRPDLILLDIMMPGIDGFEVCEILKSKDEVKEIPIIFLTAKSQIDDIYKGFKIGAVDYITKPFNPLELEVRVENHLELKRSREELKKQNDRLNLINIQVSNESAVSEDKAEYLAERIKKVLNEKTGVDDQLAAVRHLIPLIAINDLGSLKVVSKILEESTDSIDALIMEPGEEYFKILTLAVEPLKMAVADIEGVIDSMVSMGLIEKSSLSDISMSNTSFYSLLEKIYRDGKLSAEHYQEFIDLAKYKVEREEDNFTLF